MENVAIDNIVLCNIILNNIINPKMILGLVIVVGSEILNRTMFM